MLDVYEPTSNTDINKVINKSKIAIIDKPKANPKVNPKNTKPTLNQSDVTVKRTSIIKKKKYDDDEVYSDDDQHDYDCDDYAEYDSYYH